MIWIIQRQFTRYSSIKERYPAQIFCSGTIEQARELASILCGAGCDYEWYVINDVHETNEEYSEKDEQLIMERMENLKIEE